MPRGLEAQPDPSGMERRLIVGYRGGLWTELVHERPRISRISVSSKNFVCWEPTEWTETMAHKARGPGIAPRGMACEFLTPGVSALSPIRQRRYPAVSRVEKQALSMACRKRRASRDRRIVRLTGPILHPTGVNNC